MASTTELRRQFYMVLRIENIRVKMPCYTMIECILTFRKSFSID
jgi:hypothetical protein